jgi:hypothetical protein
MRCVGCARCHSVKGLSSVNRLFRDLMFVWRFVTLLGILLLFFCDSGILSSSYKKRRKT